MISEQSINKAKEEIKTEDRELSCMNLDQNHTHLS